MIVPLELFVIVAAAAAGDIMLSLGVRSWTGSSMDAAVQRASYDVFGGFGEHI